MLADSIPAAHSALVGSSRLEVQLQIETKRSHAHPKEVSCLPVRGTMPPKLVKANIGDRNERSTLCPVYQR